MIRRVCPFLVMLGLVMLGLGVRALADEITIGAGKTATIYSGGTVLTLTNLGDKPGSGTVSCKSGGKGKTYKLAPSSREGHQQNVDAAMGATCSVTAGPTDITVGNE